MTKPYLNLLGLAYRARKCILGEELIIKNIQNKHAKIVLIASDISEQTKKKIINKCTTYEVDFKLVDDRETLGQAIGKSNRVAIAIIDDGFAKKFRTLLS
ncbi:MAG TPA: YlxQ family RNA-binding protein [Pseudogracilibacillus sp.]|nr:YlxQ family RNA-binding protein [Pseudogracilibacillus sp.]